jgi:diguanylate cyclase (GGDEF)-like protein/PAS domain S-box-containing protein
MSAEDQAGAGGRPPPPIPAASGKAVPAAGSDGCLVTDTASGTPVESTSGTAVDTASAAAPIPGTAAASIPNAAEGPDIAVPVARMASPVVAVATVAILILGYALGSVLGWGGRAPAGWAGLWASVLAAVAVAAVLFRAAWAEPERIRAETLRWFAIATAAWGAGGAILSASELVSSSSQVALSFADLFLLTGLFALGAGFVKPIRLPRSAGPWLRYGADTYVCAAALFVVAWVGAFAGLYRLSGESPVDFLFELVFPLTEAALACAMLPFAVGAPAPQRRSALLAYAGLLALAVAGTVTVMARLRGASAGGPTASIGDFAEFAGLLMLGLMPWADRRARHRAAAGGNGPAVDTARPADPARDAPARQDMRARSAVSTRPPESTPSPAPAGRPVPAQSVVPAARTTGLIPPTGPVEPAGGTDWAGGPESAGGAGSAEPVGPREVAGVAGPASAAEPTSRTGTAEPTASAAERPEPPRGRLVGPGLVPAALAAAAAVFVAGRSLTGPAGAEPIVAIVAGSAVLVVLARLIQLMRENGRLRAAVETGEERFRALAESINDLVLICDLDGIVRYVGPGANRICSPGGELLGRRLHDAIHPEDLPRVERALAELVSGDGGRDDVLTIACRVSAVDGTWLPTESTVSRYALSGGADRLLITTRDFSEQAALRRQVDHLTFNDGLTGLPNRAYFEERTREVLARRRRDGVDRDRVAVVFVDLDGFTAVNDSAGHASGDQVLAQAARRLRAAVLVDDTVARWGGDEFAVLVESAPEPEALVDLAERLLHALSANPYQIAGRDVVLTASLGIAITAPDARLSQAVRDAADGGDACTADSAHPTDASVTAGSDSTGPVSTGSDSTGSDSTGSDSTGPGGRGASDGRAGSDGRIAACAGRTFSGGSAAAVGQDVLAAGTSRSRGVPDGADTPRPDPSETSGSSTTPETSSAELIRNADVALSRAKELGGARVELFADRMHADVVRRLELGSDLQRALTENQFAVEFQPVVELASSRVTGVEALVRWWRGDVFVPPEELIRHAEAFGLMASLGGWILREACGQVARWRRSGWEIGLSVNLSARQIAAPRFVESVASALADSDLPAEALTLEVTEEMVLHDAGQAAPLLPGLRDLGVRLAIDDFGTGYASLAYLGQLPVDIIKIDPSFVAGLGQDETRTLLTRTIVRLGQDLGLTVVAEGIERAEQLELLREMGCPRGQGYLIARPMAPDRIEALISAGRPGEPAFILPEPPSTAPASSRSTRGAAPADSGRDGTISDHPGPPGPRAAAS